MILPNRVWHALDCLTDDFKVPDDSIKAHPISFKRKTGSAFNIRFNTTDCVHDVLEIYVRGS